MKRDGCREAAVKKASASLPQYLHQPDPREVSALPLGNQDDCMPHSLLGQIPITKRCLFNGDELHPVGGVRCVLPSVSNQPLLEVL